MTKNLGGFFKNFLRLKNIFPENNYTSEVRKIVDQTFGVNLRYFSHSDLTVQIQVLSASSKISWE